MKILMHVTDEAAADQFIAAANAFRLQKMGMVHSGLNTYASLEKKLADF